MRVGKICVSDFRDWQDNNCIELEQVNNKTHSGDLCLDINSDIVVDYTHLADALDALHVQLNLVRFSWNSYSDRLHYFLARTQVPNILVQNYYDTNDKTPRRLLELQKLVSLSFISSGKTSLPRKFVSLAQKKQILTLLNDNAVVWSDIDICKLPYDLQLKYSLIKRTYLLRDNRIEDLIQLFNYRHKEDKDND